MPPSPINEFIVWGDPSVWGGQRKQYVCVCGSLRSGKAEKIHFTFLQLKTASVISNYDLMTLTSVNQSGKPSNGSKIIDQCLDLCVNARLQWSILTWIIIKHFGFTDRMETLRLQMFFFYHVTTCMFTIHFPVSDVWSLLLKLNWCSRRGAQLKHSCKSAVDSATVCEWGSLCMHTERSTIEAAHFISMFLLHLQESTKAKNALGVNFQAWVLNPIF